MKILYLTNIFSDRSGGSEYVIWLYAKYMARRGHKIYILCYKNDTESNTRLGKVNDDIWVEELVPEIKYSGILTRHIMPNIKYLYKGIRKLTKLKQLDINIVHSNPYIPSLLGSLLRKGLNKPHIMTIHDIGSIMGLHFLYRWFKEGESGTSLSLYTKAIMSVAYENYMLSFAPKDAIIVPSHQTKEDVCSIIKSEKDRAKVYVLPNTIDLETYKYYKRNCKISYNPFFLYIGRLVFYKNLHILINAFEKVVEENKDAKLIIVGRGPLKRLLTEYIYKRNLTSKIILTGQVSQWNKLKLLSQCLAIVNLSIFEGFSIVLLESWYFEKPVIASAVPPLTEIVSNRVDGILVNPFNVQKLSSIMLHLLENPLYARNLGLHGMQKVIKHYTPETICQNLELIYNETIK